MFGTYHVIYTLSSAWIFLFIMVCLLTNSRVTSQLAGSFATCTNEGQSVFVPLVSDNPCISCMCKNGRVQCAKEACPNLDGCYVILFDFQETRKCCDVCKGCQYEGKQYNSTSSWIDLRDPCVSYTCKASVLTKSVIQCYVPCSNPVSKPDQCCPSCNGCSFDGRKFINGENFNLSTDPCVQCSCKGGSVTCSKRGCPVMNCPESKIYTPAGACCPACEGDRKIFNLPGGRCFFKNKIYSSGKVFKPDKCTSCKCENGTSVCNRETCPYLGCPPSQQTNKKGSCCKTCPKQRQCIYNNDIYKHGQKWQPDTCTTCDCDDGMTHCQVQQCNNALWCPSGFDLQYVTGECCPKCIEARAVCTVFGDPHYRTFDGLMYNFQGTCKYLLAEDCFEKTFSVKVRNDARTSSSFTWTQMLVVYLSTVRISFHQRLKVKVNRKVITLPYTHNEDPYFSVAIDGHVVSLKSAAGLQITWDGDSFVEVTVSSKFRRKMCGLCGNFNGIESDDMTGRDGRRYENGEDFGQTWRVGSRGACVIRPELKKVESQCKSHPEALLRAKKECSFLLGSVFHTCRRRVDVRPYYRSCITDTCECPRNRTCECEAFRAYAAACSLADVNIEWEAFAPCEVGKRCPIGSRYSRCTTPCPKTCYNFNKIEPCLKPCIAGCKCRAGLVLHDSQCIPSTQCPVT